MAKSNIIKFYEKRKAQLMTELQLTEDLLVTLKSKAQGEAGNKKAPAKKVKAKKADFKTARNPKVPGAKAPKVSKTKGTSLVDAIKGVMGKEVMNAKEVFAALKAQGYKVNSNDPQGYTRYVMSTNKKAFEANPAKGRGYYQVRTEPKTGKNGTTGKVATAPAPQVNPFALASPSYQADKPRKRGFGV